MVNAKVKCFLRILKEKKIVFYKLINKINFEGMNFVDLFSETLRSRLEMKFLKKKNKKFVNKFSEFDKTK